MLSWSKFRGNYTFLLLASTQVRCLLAPSWWP